MNNNKLLSRLRNKSLAFFFTLLYNRFAFSYNVVSYLVSGGMWSEWIKVIKLDIVSDVVLELGIGPGVLQVDLQNKENTVFGIDLSRQMVTVSKNIMIKNGYKPKLVQGNGQLLPYASNSISAIVATFPTEYIFEPKTIKEISRVLRSNGKFICLPIAWITGESLGHRFLSWLFDVTGQTPPIELIGELNLEKYFRAEGFATKVDIKTLKNSKVMVLIANKGTG